MKVRDEALWTKQLSELDQDEASRKFRDFLLFWGDTLDKLIEDAFEGESSLAPAHPLSKALDVAEQTNGYLSVEWIAQMMLMFVEHWEHGQQLWEDLSFIEKRLVQQATAMKLVDLQIGASQDASQAVAQ